MYSLTVLGGLALCCGIADDATVTMAIITMIKTALVLESGLGLSMAYYLELSSPIPLEQTFQVWPPEIGRILH